MSALRMGGSLGQTSPLGAMRDLAAHRRELLLILSAVVMGFSVIFPQIGLVEWVALIPAIPALLSATVDPTVRYRRLYGLGLIFFWPF